MNGIKEMNNDFVSCILEDDSGNTNYLLPKVLKLRDRSLVLVWPWNKYNMP